MIIEMDNTPKMRTNSWKSIVSAARLETLPGAAVSVMIAIAFAIGDIYRGISQVEYSLLSVRFLLPALLCMLFALIMQINANFINDYFDAKDGFDTENRKGRERACAKGWITMPFMRKIILLTNIIAALVGLPLIVYGGWWMVAIGAACMVFSLLYTIVFSKYALGDLLVIVFFGIVPLCFTYYILTDGAINSTVIVASIACGLEVDTMLIINNFRDFNEDKLTGKFTIAQLLGKRNMLYIYCGIGFLCTCMAYTYRIAGYPMAFNILIFYLINHMNLYNQIKKIWEGKELNDMLAKNGKNILLYGSLISVGILMDLI